MKTNKHVSLMAAVSVLCVLTGILFSGCPPNDDDNFDGGGLSAPSKPVAQTLSSTSIKISWTPVNGAVQYNVYRCVTQTGSYDHIDTTREASYTDRGLSSGSTYYYRVTSVGSDGESLKSDPVAATTSAGLPAPSKPSVSGTSQTSIKLTWTVVSGAAQYKIYRCVTSTGVYQFVDSTEEGSYTDNGLTPAKMFYYKVSAVGVDGIEGPMSGYAAASTYDENNQPVNPNPTPEPEPGENGGNEESPSQAPPAPTGLSAITQSSSSILLSWSAVADASSYRVYWNTGASGTYTLKTTVSTSTYTDTGLASSTTYYYKVSAINSSAESSQSPYAWATTSGSSGGGTTQFPPSKPTGLIVSSATSGGITLSWNAAGTAESYNIYRANTQTGTQAKIGSSIQTTYIDVAPSGREYIYSVTGVNGSGESPKSGTAFAFAESHYALPTFSNAQLLTLSPSAKHYYRLEVSAGNSYTITWQNGNNENADYYIRASAWQGDGTPIFSDSNYGYTGPKVFTASVSGYVTVEVKNAHSSTSFNYQIYSY
jgi:fibronectin type 3 domain-containing protein